jgi:hypothetical protein
VAAGCGENDTRSLALAERMPSQHAENQAGPTARVHLHPRQYVVSEIASAYGVVVQLDDGCQQWSRLPLAFLRESRREALLF